MNITSLSASSIKSYEGCPKRFLAEQVRVRLSSAPGEFGTAVHTALDFFHRIVAEGDLTYDAPSLIGLWHEVCDKELGWGSDDYREQGVQLLDAYIQAHPEFPAIISAEVKEHFTVTTPNGTEVRVNYICDRVDVDANDPDGVEVIDYKTQWSRVSPAEMRTMIQPILYACAMRRKYGCVRVRVTYVMLRHEPQDVSVVFSGADMDNFERYLANVAQKILDDMEAREKLNAECPYCIRKSVCGEIRKATELGWTATVPVEELVARRNEVAASEKANASLLKEIDSAILTDMREKNLYELDTPDYTVEVTASKRGEYNAVQVYETLGEAGLRYMKVGKTALDGDVKRKRDNPFSDEEQAKLRAALSFTMGEPSLKFVKKAPGEVA